LTGSAPHTLRRRYVCGVPAGGLGAAAVGGGLQRAA